MKILAFLLIVFSSNLFAYIPVITPTNEGEVLGRNYFTYTYYQSIPYAKAPIGELRWRAPQDLEKRNKIWDGMSLKTRCAQMENYFSGSSEMEFGKVVGSEDCLYLNIWKPNTISSKKKPVFFWIHGGSNSKGLALDELYNGKKLARKLDAIVVTMNYRMGLLGAFRHPKLKFDNPLDQSGNYTTLDLLKALDWVRNNIENFGGDPNLITIAGESAGCMNVWGLIQTPLAKDKFQRAYCASGIPNNYPVLIANQVAKNMLKKTKDYALAKDMNELELRNYLYSLSTEEIIKASQNLIPIQHISDGHVFSKLGLGALAIGEFNKVPVMLGNNRNESTLFVGPLMAGIDIEDFWEILNLKKSNQALFDFINSPLKYKAFTALDETMNLSFKVMMDTILSVTGVYMPKSYRYEIDFRPSSEPWKSFFKSSHGIDIPLLFHTDEISGEHFLKFLENDLKSLQTKLIMNGFTNYVKSFVHDGEVKAFGMPSWSDWSLQKLQVKYMHISNNGFKQKSRLPRVMTLLEYQGAVQNYVLKRFTEPKSLEKY